jgi:hypothetical protein
MALLSMIDSLRQTAYILSWFLNGGWLPFLFIHYCKDCVRAVVCVHLCAYTSACSCMRALLCACTSVYLCACTSVCTCVRALLCAVVCVCAHTSACSCVHTLLHAVVCEHFCVQLCACTSVCNCVHAHLCICVQLCVCALVRMHFCVQLCVHLCAYTSVCSCVRALLCAPFASQVGKKWYISWWAWRGSDILRIVLFQRKGTACDSWAFNCSLDTHVWLLQTVIQQRLRSIMFVTQTNVLLWMWHWDYKTHIVHCLHYSCTVYLSQCVNQDCQHTAAESQGNCT